MTDEGRGRAVRDRHPAGPGRGLPGCLDVPAGDGAGRRARGWSPCWPTIRDPGNAGTVLRSADAAGADAVIFAGDSVDPYNGKAVRATRRQPVPPAGGPRRAGWRPPALAARAGLTVLAADGAGDSDSTRADRPAGAGRPDRVAVRVRGVGAAGGDRRAGRRPGPDPDLAPRGEPEPGRRGRGLPVRLGNRPATSSVALFSVRRAMP